MGDGAEEEVGEGEEEKGEKKRWDAMRVESSVLPVPVMPWKDSTSGLDARSMVSMCDASRSSTEERASSWPTRGGVEGGGQVGDGGGVVGAGVEEGAEEALGGGGGGKEEGEEEEEEEGRERGGVGWAGVSHGDGGERTTAAKRCCRGGQ